MTTGNKIRIISAVLGLIVTEIFLVGVAIYAMEEKDSGHFLIIFIPVQLLTLLIWWRTTVKIYNLTQKH